MESEGVHGQGSGGGLPGIASAARQASASQRTPYQAPLLTIVIAALILAITLAERALLSSGGESGFAAAPTGVEVRFRVVFAGEARAADIASLLAGEGLSVLSGPDAQGAYTLGAADPRHPPDPSEVLRQLQTHRTLVRASGLAVP